MNGAAVLPALSALALAVVFGVAGAAKLRDRGGAASTARGFGLPSPLAGFVGALLPVVELAVAILLVPPATRWWAAVAALALLAAFCSAVVVAIVRGVRPQCRCFGRLHASPVGWVTLARNGVLVLLAGIVVSAGPADPGPAPIEWVRGLGRTEWLVVGLATTVAVLAGAGGALVLHLLRSHGRVLVRLERLEAQLRDAGFDLDDPEDVPRLGLEPGTAAPAFWLPSVEGDRVALGDLLEPGRPALLLFTSPTCGPCTHLVPSVAAWQREHADELTIALLSTGAPDAVRAEAAEHGLVNVLLDEGTAYEAYGANGTPSAVLVADDGTIGSWLAAGREWIESLVEQALGGLGRTPGLPVGSELPAELVERVDGETVVLFWNPDCGFCQAMHEDLLGWEASPPVDAPGLLVVSSGDGPGMFASPVVLDPGWELAGHLGADGTPTALLVGADRRIASPLVSGGEAILQLLGAEAAAAV